MRRKKQLVNFRTLNGESLSEELLHTYETIFQRDWERYGKLSWEQKEQLAVDAIVESKLRTFNGREALLNKYYEKVINEQGALILQGEVGSGKTSIMCKLMEKLAQDGKHVFRFIAGNSSMSETAMQLVQQMVYYLEEVLQEEHFKMHQDESIKRNLEGGSEDKYSNVLERLIGLAARLDEEQMVYFVIDALDQMYQDESMKSLDFVLANTKLRYILSCTTEFKIPEVKNGCNLVVEKVPLLSVEDAKEVIEGILTASSRNVYKDMQEAILSKKSANNPLYISMLIQRLNMMGFDELYGAWTEELREQRYFIYLGYGIVLFAQGKMEEAISVYQQSIQMLDEIQTEDSQVLKENALRTGYLNLGNAYFHKGDEQEAIVYFEKALEISLEKYQRKHDLRGLNHVLNGYNSVGTVLTSIGRLEEAEQYFEKAIEIAEVIVEKRSDWQGLEDIATVYGNVSGMLQKQERLEEALEYACEALNIKVSLFKKRKEEALAQSISQICKGISHILALQKLDENATLERYHFLYQIVQNSISKKDMMMIDYTLGDIMALNERPQEAVAYYEHAMDRLNALYSENPEQGYLLCMDYCRERISKIKNTGAN